MKLPFSSLSPSRRRVWLIGSLVLTFALEAALIWSGASLRTEAAPWGIVSFEFAGDLAGAEAMLASWGHEGVVAAAFNLGLDYAFLLAYAVALALACVAVVDGVKARAGGYARIGAVVAWTPFGAVLLDAVENAALIQVVFGAQAAVWLVLAWWCALVKFILVGLGILYVLGGLGVRFFSRP